ncbi:MAG TPA: hypothetical protein VHZ99_01650 [Steroidobacteraceae bacterium]|jgi:hypothetical protein|nr:hypothetical protein [Steroidobacteraceae bacterium]
MRVRLIGKSNGLGLSRDLELLGAALQSAGCEVTQQPCDRRERRRRRSWLTGIHARLRRPNAQQVRFDVNVMLEHVWPQFLHEARCNVLVPNPEWFERRDSAMLSRIDRVWSKTALTHRLFASRGCAVSNIGFDSEDRLVSEVVREARFLHVGGRSELKGTHRLLEFWRQHPEWPPLTVIRDTTAMPKNADPAAPNVTVLREFVDDQTLRTLQNSHRFHVCLSEAEGWGHYIVEALGVGAVTLTCDAAPMNELVTAERGLLVRVVAGRRHRLVELARFEPEALEAVIHRCAAMPEDELQGIAARARDWFVHNKQQFPVRVHHALAELENRLA